MVSCLPPSSLTVAKPSARLTAAGWKCSSLLTQGPAVPAFEQAFVLLWVPTAVTVNSATSASIWLVGLGLGPVIVLTHDHFCGLHNCARYCGAEVDFVDIVPETGLLCLEALSVKLLQQIAATCLN